MVRVADFFIFEIYPCDYSAMANRFSTVGLCTENPNRDIKFDMCSSVPAQPQFIQKFSFFLMKSDSKEKKRFKCFYFSRSDFFSSFALKYSSLCIDFLIFAINKIEIECFIEIHVKCFMILVSVSSLVIYFNCCSCRNRYDCEVVC